MRIDPKCKLEKAVSQDYTRGALVNPYVQGDKIVATDGKIMAVVTVDDKIKNLDTDGYIPVEALRESRKNQGFLEANGQVKLGDGRTFPRPDDFHFPQWEQIVESVSHKPVFTVSLNPQMLKNLADALGVGKGESVTLKFFAADHAFKVEVNQSKNIGVMMPVKIVA